MTFNTKITNFLEKNTDAYQIDDVGNGKVEIWFQIKHKFGEEAIDFVIGCDKTVESFKKNFNLLRKSATNNVFIIEEIRKPNYSGDVRTTVKRYDELMSLLPYLYKQL